MRLWSIHPEYLDSKGLVALWREALLAQKVLKGETKGYKKHPQLYRFQKTEDPVSSVAKYLLHVAEEADKRGYKFDKRKIEKGEFNSKISVTGGQIRYEFDHLLGKLEIRDPLLFNKLKIKKNIKLHPLFKKVDGAIEKWEVV